LMSSTGKVFVLFLLLSLCIASPANLARAQPGPSQQSEKMYVYWLLGEPGELWTNSSWTVWWNVLIHVYNVSAPLIPLNLSESAFNDHFEGAEFDAEPYGFRNWWLTFHASYLPMNVDLAKNYTGIICAEFQQAFNLPARVVGKTYTIDNQTGTITVYCDLGYFNETAEFSEGLLKYRPQDGFCQLITPGTVDAYLDPRGSILEIIYSLVRTDAGVFYWSFQTGFYGAEDASNGGYANLDLNGLLNRTGEIMPATLGNSTILVEVQNNDTANGQLCSLSVENISPAYDSRATPHGTLIITYNLKAPINDIFATVRVTIRNEAANPLQPIEVLTAIIAAVALVSGIVVLLRRRRKPEETHDSSYAKIGGEKT